MSILSDVDGPHQPSNGNQHDFQELLVMTLSAVLSDCDTIEDVAAWSRAHTGWLRQFLVLKHGIPSEDNFLRIFSLLDPKQFESCFRRWVSHLIPKLSGTIAVDGKTVRGSGGAAKQRFTCSALFRPNWAWWLIRRKYLRRATKLRLFPNCSIRCT